MDTLNKQKLKEAMSQALTNAEDALDLDNMPLATLCQLQMIGASNMLIYVMLEELVENTQPIVMGERGNN